jgi:hypothetical protein
LFLRSGSIALSSPSTMRLPAGLLASGIALVAACHPGSASPAASGASNLAVECPPGLQSVHDNDSDVGWGEIEQTRACARDGITLQGRAIELVASAPTEHSTRLVGQYIDGRRVGTWTQLDPDTGRVLGTFTLDEGGSGTEVIRDQLGHMRRGAVVAGKREGTWTHYDSDGKVVATETWNAGRFILRKGDVPWDPPMVDPADRCPDPGDGYDGCPGGPG